MAANPLLAAHGSARRVDRGLDRLFGRYVGTKAAHPRGRVLAAYTQARRAMLRVLDAGGPRATAEALEVVATLRRELYDVGRLALPGAMELGRTSAAEQLAAYQADGVQAQPAFAYPDQQELEAGWRTAVDARLDPVQALVAAGAEPGLIANEDGGRLGALQPGPFQNDAAYWLAFAVALAFSAWLLGRKGEGAEERAEQSRFRRQAVPAIDERTTPCCLDVAKRGQAVGLNEPFYTPEPPAYSRRQRWTPFHDWCRTSVVLYLPEYDDGITAKLQADAAAELGRRP